MSGIPPTPVHHTAVVDEPWDRNAAVSAMPNDDEVLHYCFAWESQAAVDAPSKKDDDDADDQKGQYSFPHHTKKGGPANLAACRNGLSRLEGSNIPDADKAGVKAHLQAHLDDGHKGGADDGKSENVAGFRLVDEAAWSSAVRLGNLVSEERVREHAARVQRVSDGKDFFRISNATGDVATLDIYDDIGFWGVSANDFNRQLKAITASSITVHINSPGGDVFDGVAILNMLRAHPAEVHVVVDGLAASAASFISMAGKSVTMMPNSTMMIHDASGVCMGNNADMQQMADLLDKVSNNLASIYSTKAGGSTEDWRNVMRAETWYTADEAVEAGLADRVGDTDTPSDVVVATDRWNYSFYNYDGRSAAPAPVAAAVQQIPAAVSPPVEAVVPAPVAVSVQATAPTPVAVVPPVSAPAVAPTPVLTPVPAAAPAVEPALADRREDDTPVWDREAFRQALKARAAR